MARFDDEGFQYDNPAFHYDTAEGGQMDLPLTSPELPVNPTPRSIQHRVPKTYLQPGRDWRRTR